MRKPGKITSAFSFQGKLTKIRREKKKVKYIKLATSEGKYWIKVGKKLRPKVANLSKGCELEIAGKTKQAKPKGKIRYQAQAIAIVPQPASTPTVKTKTTSLLPIFEGKAKSKAKVLICQKSNCWKKGGNKVFQELESVLEERNLSDKIQIKKTGCLKKCKKAPNLVMLPDKAQYTKVKTKQVKGFVEKHLLAEK